MSDIIQLLPDSVANQIAAGEVIQRPASVIKELVENSIDAGATEIHVLVVDAGRTSIQVIDNGRGMSETDARLAFERHATSKIRQADDLFALHTMGFRGEALASIAAVAQVELTTRLEGDEIGTRLTLSASRVTAQEPVACPVGSNFKVQNLFFNVPARRKFLKSNVTELNNILTAFQRIVLVYPDVAFSLHSNGSELLSLKAGSLHQRIADVFGRRFNQDLLPVSVETALCTVGGFVGKPETARKKSAHQYFFVNGRYMRHPYFHKAVLQAFDRLVPEGEQPPYFLYFTVPPADIDVNIHPVKTEIKFENELAIWQILGAAVKEAIGKFCEVPTIDFDTEGRPDIPPFDPSRDDIAAPRVTYNPAYNPFAAASSAAPAVSSVASAASSPVNGGNAAVPVSSPSRPPEGWSVLYDGLASSASAPSPSLFGDVPASADALLTDKSPAHYQYKGRYIMTAVKSGLMVIDQQRADVRIRYERCLQQLQARAAQSERLLFPEMVQFPPADAVVAERLLPQLAAIGFELTSIGGNSYAVSGVPAGLAGMNYVALIQQMVADAAVQPKADATAVQHALALSLARSAALPQGQVLANDEMENLINDLFACSNVNYTPDGKPILAILPHHDIEQLLA